jgi:hypothetical protein
MWPASIPSKETRRLVQVILNAMKYWLNSLNFNKDKKCSFKLCANKQLTLCTIYYFLQEKPTHSVSPDGQMVLGLPRTKCQSATSFLCSP